MNQRTKNIKLAFPILSIMIGLFFIFIVATMTESAGFTFRLFTAGPFLLFFGIGTLIAPMDLPVKENEEDEDPALNLGVILKGAPRWKLVVWGGALIAGVMFRDEVIGFLQSLM